MTEAAQIHALMTENGPRLELAEVTASEEHGQWTLVVDEATVLFADWDEERQCVWLSAEVGAPAAGDQLGCTNSCSSTTTAGRRPAGSGWRSTKPAAAS
jgi:hypothetical protein